MPGYLDYHYRAPELPPEVVEQVAKAMKAGEIDELGAGEITSTPLSQTGRGLLPDGGTQR